MFCWSFPFVWFWHWWLSYGKRISHLTVVSVGMRKKSVKFSVCECLYAQRKQTVSCKNGIPYQMNEVRNMINSHVIQNWCALEMCRCFLHTKHIIFKLFDFLSVLFILFHFFPPSEYYYIFCGIIACVVNANASNEKLIRLHIALILPTSKAGQLSTSSFSHSQPLENHNRKIISRSSFVFHANKTRQL